MSNVYAGIGARVTPKTELPELTAIAKRLEEQGYILQSGNGDGPDIAFQNGAKNCIVFPPWDGFNGGHPNAVKPPKEMWQKALKIVVELHPNARGLVKSVLAMHCRNVFILLGEQVNRPVDFVVYKRPTWTTTGGTSMGIKIADKFNIPKYNLSVRSDYLRFYKDLEAGTLPRRTE